MNDDAKKDDQGGLTDEQIQALDALDKYSLIQDLVTRLVNNRMAGAGSGISADELVLLADYRRWKESPQSASGVFHWRRR